MSKNGTFRKPFRFKIGEAKFSFANALDFAAMTSNTEEVSPNNGVLFPPQSPLFYLRLSVYWFALSFLWAGLITIVIASMVETFDKANKDLWLGVILAAGALVSTIVSLWSGILSDRMDARHRLARWGRRRPFIFIGTVLTIPILLLWPQVQNIAQLLIVFCLLQLFINIGATPYQALVPDLVPKDKQGAASAYMGMGSLLGQLGGLVLCGVLLQRRGGLTIVMVTIAAVLLLALGWTMWRVPEKAIHTPGAAALGKAPGISPFQVLFGSLRSDMRDNRDFFLLIASRFVINTGFYTATQFLLYYVTDTLRAPNPQQTVVNLSLFSLVSGLIGNFPAGIYSDRFSKKLVIYISATVTGFGAILFVTTSSIPVAYFAAFFFGAGFGAFQAVDWAMATNLLPERDEAKFMGIWHLAFTVPQVIAPLIGGGVAYFFNAQFGGGFGYRVVLFLVVVYLFLGTLLIRPIREKMGRG